MTKYILFLTLVFTAAHVYGQTQPDTIIVYNLNTQVIDTILPVTFNSTPTFDKTASSVGSLGNQVPLSLSPPTTNLFAYSNFSDIARAELFFNVTDYPIRTAVELQKIINGISIASCSGIMVAPGLVLTAGHCIFDFNNQSFFGDSLLVAPAYDNGIIQTSLPSSLVDKVYIFKRYYDKKNFDDIALLQLQQPIGQQIGWTGIAFSSDTSYFTGKVFHKFSYPGEKNPFDTTKHYNGDTLYYNYGYVDKLYPSWSLGVLSPSANGIPGQSGSAFLYTDNFEYYSFGVFSFSGNYRHFQITKNVFYQFKNIIDNYLVSSQEIFSQPNTIRIYPNPFTTQTILRTDKFLKNASLTVYNSSGQTVKQVNNLVGQTIFFHRDNLPSGLYFVRLTQDGKTFSADKFLIVDE